MTEEVVIEGNDLVARFPEWVKPDERNGYEASSAISDFPCVFAAQSALFVFMVSVKSDGDTGQAAFHTCPKT